MACLDDINTALITGASGGIGEAFARQLAARGKNLILVARSKAKLEALAAKLAEDHGVGTHVIAADLAEVGAAGRVFAETERQGLVVDLLVNNAGFGKGGKFTELSFDVQVNMVRLNINTLMELSHLYLLAMRERKLGGIINLGSTASFQPVPYMAVYGATKAFVLSFSEALAEEVVEDGVSVMALCPGGTATGFQATAAVWEEERDTMPTPADVVSEALEAFDCGKSSFVHGTRNRLTAFMVRFAPRKFAARAAGRLVSDH